MSNVVYIHEKPQAEIEREEYEARAITNRAAVIAALPTQYDGYKFTEVQRKVVEQMVILFKADNPAVHRIMTNQPALAYSCVYLWVTYSNASFKDAAQAGQMIAELGEDSEAYREVMAWADFMTAINLRFGHQLDDSYEVAMEKSAPLMALQRELNLSAREVLVIWFEDMLANC